jgi:adenylate cyclase
MQQEIERKFLVKNDDFKKDKGLIEEINIVQGYLSKEAGKVIRVRTSEYRVNPQYVGFITIKLKREDNVGVDEYEYSIPPLEAYHILARCEYPLLEKERYVIDFKGVKWEVDVFHGHKAGLIVAEVELKNADQVVELPEWIGEEVTGRPEYYNSNM